MVRDQAGDAAPGAHVEPRQRGQLKVYLGATPGAGKTYAMLREAHELMDHGHDVVVAFVETYGRPKTVSMLERLEILPRKKVAYRGTELEDMDLDAVLARRPEIALVDELAHTNAPGLRKEKRWQDVEILRDAGIDVISTVNVQHLESVKDLVEKVSSVPVKETVPDRVLDGADVVQFIDIAPEALRKRMRHGNVYPPEKVDVALAHFFRPRNLAAMRQIGLRLVADSMARSRAVVRSPEDVLVAVSCGGASEELMRRGARLARRRGGSCVVVTVQPDADCGEKTERFRMLAAKLGCSFAVLGGVDVPAAIIQTAKDVGVEHVVVGEFTGGDGLGRLRPTLVDRIIDGLPGSDIHVIARVRRAAGRREAKAEPGSRPDPVALLRQLSSDPRRRAMLRVYLGYAPGCGTTTAMLDEGRRRAGRGTDVAVAAFRVHGDSRTALAGLEVVGGLRGAPRERALDLESVLARNPEVVCIDDLMAPDSHGRPQLDAVPALIKAGITVLATLHLLSVDGAAEAVSEVLGRRLQPIRGAGWHGGTVSVDFLHTIDELEVVDMPPEELLLRIREKSLLGPAEQAFAMQQQLRPRILASLRETALRMCANHADRQFIEDLRKGEEGTPTEVRGRLVLCLPVRRGLEERVHWAAGYARALDATFTVVSVHKPGLSDEDKTLIGEYVSLTHQLQGEFVRLDDSPVSQALARFVERSLATEVVIGHRRRPRWRPWDTTSELIRLLQGVDIHILRR